MTGRTGTDLGAAELGYANPVDASPVDASPGKERAIRARLTELLGPVEEWSTSLVAALITSFLARAADYLEALADAIRRQDADAVARDGHSVKGMAGNLGAAHLAALGAAMEACGRSGQLAPASRLLAQMTAELDAVRPAMQHVLAS